MSPRARITANVDFEVDVDIESQQTRPRRSKTVSFRTSRNEPAMSAWLQANRQNRSAAIARLVDEFVKRNGTDDISEEIPVESLMSSSGDCPPHVTLRKESSLAWLRNQANASASIRHVIRLHLDQSKPVRTTVPRAVKKAQKKKTKHRTPKGQTRKILAQVDLCIFHDDAKLVSWLDAQTDRQSSVRRALEMFTQRHGFHTLDGTGTSTFHRAEDHARLIHLNIYDEHIAQWLEDQIDPSAAVRHALRWYVEECTSARPTQEHGSRRIAVMQAAPIPTNEASSVTSFKPVDVAASAQAAQPAQRTVSGETLQRVIEIQNQISALNDQIQQLIPGAHRAWI